MGGKEVEVKCEPNWHQTIKTLQILTATRKRARTKKKKKTQKTKLNILNRRQNSDSNPDLGCGEKQRLLTFFVVVLQ